MKPPLPRKALLALVSTLTLALVGLPVAVRNLGADATDRPSTVDALAAAGAAQWGAEPTTEALLAAGTGRGRAEQFYFVLPDRFANGDRRNDTGGLTGDRLRTGLDPTDKGFYHGGDLKGVIDKLDYIQGLGTTAIWLAPVFKNRPVQGSGADVSAGYHGYWITDFTQVDPHFGTNEEMKRLVRLAHQRGIKVYLDVIVNHTADVIKYAEDRYAYVDKKTSPYTDAQGREFEDRNYADGTRDFPTVNRDSGAYTPTFASPADAKVKVPAWLNDPTMYHNRGDSTFSGENSEYGDFYGLDDLWTERPEVVRGLTKAYGDWIASTDVDGFRLDTVKHVNLDFWPQFSQGIKRAADKAGKKDFFMFGEVYSADQEVTSTYVRRGGLPATLDFSFQEAARGYVTADGSAKALADVYAKDPLYAARDTDAGRLTTFLGNHDMGRIGSFIAAAGGDDARQLGRDRLAHQLMFLTRGQPVVYSGDEQGFTGPGGDKDARQDMFATRTADYLDDDLIGTTRTHASDQYDTTHPLYRTIAELGRLRAAHPGLRDGVQVTRYAADGPGVFAFSRISPADRTEYLVAVNNAGTPQTVRVETWSPGTTFTGIYGGTATSAAGTDGHLNLTVPAGSAVVLRAGRPVPQATTKPTVTLTGPGTDPVATRAAVTAQVTGDPLATVTVAARVAGGKWTLLGSAHTAPYTVHHDLTGLAGGTRVEYKAVVRDGKGRTAATRSTAVVGTPAQGASRDWVVVHYQRPAGGYADWGLYAWGDLDPAYVTQWPAGQPFAGEDSYGRFAWVKLKPGAKSVGFLVVDKAGTKDVADDRTIDVTTTGEVWVKQGDPALYPTRQAATGEPDPPVDPNTAVIHWRKADNDYAGWGLHVWDGAATPTDWASPLPPEKVDSFGAVFRVPLAAGATGLNYIIHRGDTKDQPDDQRLDLTGVGHEVWLLGGVPGRLLPPSAVGPAKHVDITKQQAKWIDRATVAWSTGPTDGKAYALVAAPAGGLGVVDGELSGTYTTLPLRAQRNGLTEAQRAAFPHLWSHQAFRLDRADLAKVPAALRGQLVVTERDARGALLGATGVQIPGVLDDVYRAATDATLGVTFAGTVPTLAVWAPTARTVALELSDTPSAPPRTVAMRRDDRTGVWSVRGSRDWTGRYYRYRVEAWQPAAQKVVTASVTDPYSVALAADSTHSRIVDLTDPALAPPGWSGLRKPAAPPAAQAQISELSVRDFSIADTTVPADRRGTYLAFTDPGTAGMKHLRALGDAGVDYLHLLPVFDFATIPEKRADQRQPDCDLAALPPDSDRQQACVAAVADTDGYNWGYDPLHYTVPEGGYAVDPDGERRTTEFRRMVAGINGAGLRVVLDVVYNHTSAAGTDAKSVLDQVVPGYYHRLLDDGTVANSTCCANTAPEHAMMGKLVVDSLVVWAKQYKVDGFRFDLMGHHPKANILAVRAALDRLTLARDGVDGKKILLYGEGWNFGEVADDARFVQATQANMAGTGIGTFNDRLRDAVRGGGPFDANPRVQGFASGLYTDPNGDPVNGTAAEQQARLRHQQDLIKVGLTGNLRGYRFTDSTGRKVTGAQVDYNGSPAGYTAAPGEAVTYVDAHDNEILYDALAYKLPTGTSATDRARMQVLALATTVLGQGTGFVAAGSERLRSKSLDRNSYNSGDWFNQIRWDCTQGNGFGAGLPPAADNQDKWPYAKPLLADPALVPDCAAIDLADARYAELLRIRRSSPVFGLSTAEQVQQRVAFPLSGVRETPGVLTMTLDARGLGGRWRSVTVVLNGTPTAAKQTVTGLRGTDTTLHPVLADSADPVLRTASFDRAAGTFTVPARSVAVFVQR
ncbi:pullulanase-type alpha-1,6-glucosidase [Micromonospora rifamycinica]|uniref:1,4-alpha-D-glucan glucanohydrolase n=1 Tax=Micromonospora rifamycinica TaxID=291594 RepID=A0A109IIL7_9ACTN|nr:pullulanase-type alpha-1,6-glucosidase [Micromonospora rifamycinica]KWV31227.1 sulfonate ABC transporter ATP-binding protein [Micromonospora rifamycinica]SCG81261.1 alpha-1,6-glucosidases, pullulanase-type [Micromonospora rifamycinica]